MPILQVKGFRKRFTIPQSNKKLLAVEGIDFSLEAGEFIGIVGKSGSGKSTILKSIYRTHLPDAGEIWYHSGGFGMVDMAKISERKVLYLRKYEIGYISQSLNVRANTTCRELVTNVLLDVGEPEDAASREAEGALTLFELDSTLWDSYPDVLSRSDKLKLSIAMAIVKKPRLILLDEPTAGLGQDDKLKMRKVIEKLQQKGVTLVGIFRDIEFMEGLCDKVYDMKTRKLTVAEKENLENLKQ